jgi:uncharacterized protein
MAATPEQSNSNTLNSELRTPHSLADWLSTPEAYADCPASVQRIETHISCVFLTDKFAYKLKKPVRFDFLDFSTAELRRRACEEEIRLNRRLAPHVYLGLVAVRRENEGQYRLDESDSTSDADAIDWLVKMRRLPEEVTLQAKIDGAAASEADAAAIAHRLAEFYLAAASLPIQPPQYRAEIERHVRANRAELLYAEHSLNVTVIKRIHAAQLRLLQFQPELFDARVIAGRIINGHGDLRPEHIYLLPSQSTQNAVEPAIIDCIEFNAEFRHLDIADELSFLATECDFAGAEALGRRIFEQTSAALNDNPPPELIAFYRSYRACVRAKVTALRAKQQSGNARAASYREAQRHLQWAERYDRQLPAQFLLVMCGLMGSGKSTLAARLADLFGAEMLSTDSIRQQIFGKSQQPLDYGAGHYRAEDRMRVYEEMLRQGQQNLDDGLPVILDGAFPYARLRTTALELARGENLPGLVVHCRCSNDVARQRIATRLSSGQGTSEARPELYDRQREEQQPHPPGVEVIDIDTTEPLDRQVQIVIERLRLSPGVATPGL